MEKPIFVVLRKAFHSINGVDVAYCPDGMDVRLFSNYSDALQDAKSWCECYARDVEVFCELGELSHAASCYNNLCAQVVGYRCYVSYFTRVGAEIYQKYFIS